LRVGHVHRRSELFDAPPTHFLENRFEAGGKRRDAQIGRVQDAALESPPVLRHI
jgi:hypothetical protein